MRSLNQAAFLNRGSQTICGLWGEIPDTDSWILIFDSNEACADAQGLRVSPHAERLQARLEPPHPRQRLRAGPTSRRLHRPGGVVRVRGSAPKRGRHSSDIFSPPNASVQRQPDGLTIHTQKWFLGARLQGAPPISLRWCARTGPPAQS